MLVLVCGSRGWTDTHAIRDRMADLPASSIILHGKAPGVDTFAGWIANDLGFTVREFPADWERYGKRAGIVRNLAMLDESPDLVLAFWDGESSGTRHTVTEARKRGIPVEVIGS